MGGETEGTGFHPNLSVVAVCCSSQDIPPCRHTYPHILARRRVGACRASPGHHRRARKGADGGHRVWQPGWRPAADQGPCNGEHISTIIHTLSGYWIGAGAAICTHHPVECTLETHTYHHHPLTAPSPLAHHMQAVTKACAKRDMLLMSAGARECVRFLPPLTVSASEVDQALDIFGQALDEVLKK